MKKAFVWILTLLLIGSVSVCATDALVTLVKTDTATLQAAEGVFPEGTVVTAEQVDGGKPVVMAETVLGDVTTKRTVYNIFALKDGKYIQPSSTVTATFTIPDSYDLAKIMVYYVSEYGESELLESTVNTEARTVTTALPHFSTFVVSEKAPPKVIEIPGSKKPSSLWWIWVLVGGVAILGGLVTWRILRKRKA